MQHIKKQRRRSVIAVEDVKKEVKGACIPRTGLSLVLQCNEIRVSGSAEGSVGSSWLENGVCECESACHAACMCLGLRLSRGPGELTRNAPYCHQRADEVKTIREEAAEERARIKAAEELSMMQREIDGPFPNPQGPP